MLFLDGVYVGGVGKGSACFRWVRLATSQELTQLAQTIARQVSRYLERQELLERDIETVTWPRMLFPVDRWISYWAIQSPIASR